MLLAAGIAALSASACGDGEAESRPRLAAQPGSEPCETSAAIALDDGRILVGDNETKDGLFAYVWDKAGVRPATPFEITWDVSAGRKIEDIEALARAGNDLYVIGSHSRKKDCVRDVTRFRILRARIAGSTLQDATVMRLACAPQDDTWQRATSDPSACLANLFTEDAQSSTTARSFCEALVEAERGANGMEGGSAQARCQRTLNIEGAAIVGGRLWLGLRAPLVGSERRAVLLRVREAGSEFRFDAAALVDLRGEGIRELTTLVVGSRSKLWGIAGPMEDISSGDPNASRAFSLWAAEASAVQPEALLHPLEGGVLADLPASSEGLVLRLPDVLVWIDGDGKYPDPCKKPHSTSIFALRP